MWDSMRKINKNLGMVPSMLINTSQDNLYGYRRRTDFRNT